MKINLITVVTCAVIGISAQAQNLLVNGSFESPVIGQNSLSGTPPTGWVFGNSCVLFNGSFSSFPLPANGNQYVDFGINSGFSVSRTFTVTNSGDYALTWVDNAHNQFGPATPYAVQILSTPGNSSVFSVTLTPSLDVWVSRSNSVTLVAGQYIISFTPTQSGADRLLDNVALVAAEGEKAISISTQPQSQLGYWGQSVSFSVAATNGTPPYTYQWQKDSASVSGATNALLILPNLQFTNAGAYTAIVFDSASNSVTSNPANLTINPAGVGIALYPGVKIDGVVGLIYGIQSSTNLADTNSWIGVTNLTFTVPTEIWYDSIPASLAQRFYRVLQGPIPIP